MFLTYKPRVFIFNQIHLIFNFHLNLKLLVNFVIIKLSITSKENGKLQTSKFNEFFEFQCVISNSPKPPTVHKDIIPFQYLKIFLAHT